MIRYLYLDDEELRRLEPLTDAVTSDRQELQIDIKHPSQEVADIGGFIEKIQEYDGLILDWRLSDIVDPNTNQRFGFRAGSLAQEIRTRETEKEITAKPIILWSTEDKLRGSFLEDSTAQDLFDRRYDKSEISEDPIRVQTELLVLAKDYAKIDTLLQKKARLSVEEILVKEAFALDIRLKHQIELEALPVHELARFILLEILERPGTLIDEGLLAARLGVDRGRSPDWIKLLQMLPSACKYRGIFGDGWLRWWSACVEQDWWRSLGEAQHSLSVLDANTRIEILIKETGLTGLQASNPLQGNYHTKYYTICEYYQTPLDPLDGVILDEPEPQPWQVRKYLSLDVALERRGEERGLFPHPTELERLSELRKSRV